MSIAADIPSLESLVTLRDFERAARARVERTAWDYFRSGADAERTLRRNVRAFRAWEIWYRVLVDVANVDTSTTVLGTRVPFPVLIAPTAYHRLAHPDGEIATARAAASLGTVYVASTLATTSLEDVATSCAGPRWFQLYVHKDREFTRELAQRAEHAGYGAIVLTVDTPVLGRRLRDERNHFGLPAGLTMANLVGARGLAHVDGSMLAKYVASRHDASLNWADLEWLGGLTKLPIVLKGIVRGDDAARAAEHGVAGVIVSNHGGRQLGASPATIDALRGVVDAVQGRCDVLMDGGVRWGTDVLVALALGARAVLVGRPVLWGLAVGGEPGVRRVLEILRDELTRAMALAGCATLDDAREDLVQRRA